MMRALIKLVFDEGTTSMPESNARSCDAAVAAHFHQRHPHAVEAFAPRPPLLRSQRRATGFGPFGINVKNLAAAAHASAPSLPGRGKKSTSTAAPTDISEARLKNLHATEKELLEGGGITSVLGSKMLGSVKKKVWGSGKGKASQYDNDSGKKNETPAGGGENEAKLTGMLRTFDEIFSVPPAERAKQQPGEETELGVISDMMYDKDGLRCKYDISGLGRRPPSVLEYSMKNMVSKLRQANEGNNPEERPLPNADIAKRKAEEAIPRWIHDHLEHDDNLGCRAPILRKAFVNHTWKDDHDENTTAGGGESMVKRTLKGGASLAKKAKNGLRKRLTRKKKVYILVAGHFDPGARKEGISLNLRQRPSEDHNGASAMMHENYRHEECFAARDYEVVSTTGRLRDFRETLTHLRNNRAKKIDHVLVNFHGNAKAAGGEIKVIPDPEAEDKKNPEKIIDPASEAGYFFKELARALSWDHSVKPRRMPLFAEVTATVSPYFKVEIQKEDILRSSMQDGKGSEVEEAPGLNLKAKAEVRLMRWKPKMEHEDLFHRKEMDSKDRKTQTVRGQNKESNVPKAEGDENKVKESAVRKTEVDENKVKELDVRKTEDDVYILRFRKQDLVEPDTTKAEQATYFCESETAGGGSGNVVKAFPSASEKDEKKVITIPAWRPRVELSILAPRAVNAKANSSGDPSSSEAPASPVEAKSAAEGADAKSPAKEEESASPAEESKSTAKASESPASPGEESKSTAEASESPASPGEESKSTAEASESPASPGEESPTAPNEKPAEEQAAASAAKASPSSRSWRNKDKTNKGKQDDNEAAAKQNAEAALKLNEASSSFRRPFNCTAVLKEKAVLGKIGEWKPKAADKFLAAVEGGKKASASGEVEGGGSKAAAAETSATQASTSGEVEGGDSKAAAAETSATQASTSGEVGGGDSKSSSWNFKDVVQRDAVDIARKELLRTTKLPSDPTPDGESFIVRVPTDIVLTKEELAEVANEGDADSRPHPGDVIEEVNVKISVKNEAKLTDVLKDWSEENPIGPPMKANPPSRSAETGPNEEKSPVPELHFEVQNMKWRRPNFYNTLGTGVSLRSCSTAKEDESIKPVPHGDSAKHEAGAEKVGNTPRDAEGGEGEQQEGKQGQEVQDPEEADPAVSAILPEPPPQTVAHAIAKYLHTQRDYLAKNKLQYDMVDTGTPMEMPQPQDEKNPPVPEKAESGAESTSVEASASAGEEHKPDTTTTDPASKGPIVIPLRFTASNIDSTWSHYRGINPLLGHCLDTATATMSEPAFVDFLGERKFWEGPKTKRAAELLYKNPEDQWMFAQFKNGGDDYHGYTFPNNAVAFSKQPEPKDFASGASWWPWLMNKEDKIKNKTKTLDQVRRLSAMRSYCTKAVIPSSDPPLCIKEKDSSKGDGAAAGEDKESGKIISPAVESSSTGEQNNTEEQGDGGEGDTKSKGNKGEST